ncbi:MAG: hypothetical protein WBP72_10310, partial [Rhodocyclaceae bacterium]
MKPEQCLTTGEGIPPRALDCSGVVPCKAESRMGSHLAEGETANGVAAPAEHSPRRKLEWGWVVAGVAAAGLLAYLGTR